MISIKEAAKLTGVTAKTLRLWELEGKLHPKRTNGGHRRYDVSELIGSKSDKLTTIAYGRVSSHDQKEDLKRQELVLESYCASKGFEFELISDLGSGLNYKKKAFEILEHHEVYAGKRIKRGLFQSSTGKLVNADVNGGTGISRKVFGDSVISQIFDSGLAFNPIKINIF